MFQIWNLLLRNSAERLSNFIVKFQSPLGQFIFKCWTEFYLYITCFFFHHSYRKNVPQTLCSYVIFKQNILTERHRNDSPWTNYDNWIDQVILCLHLSGPPAWVNQRPSDQIQKTVYHFQRKNFSAKTSSFLTERQSICWNLGVRRRCLLLDSDGPETLHEPSWIIHVHI